MRLVILSPFCQLIPTQRLNHVTSLAGIHTQSSVPAVNLLVHIGPYMLEMSFRHLDLEGKNGAETSVKDMFRLPYKGQGRRKS